MISGAEVPITATTSLPRSPRTSPLLRATGIPRVSYRQIGLPAVVTAQMASWSRPPATRSHFPSPVRSVPQTANGTSPTGTALISAARESEPKPQEKGD